MTAEFAVALPAIALVLASSLAAVHVAAVQVRLADAAADAARALGRGESEAVAAGIAARNAAGARMSTSIEDPFVCATLTGPAGGILSGLELQAESCAVRGGR
ncbi:TadE family type IV pilus minor pilin [Agromyces aurantiacus]|uniref:TadE family type IV pilus minor pilin n=1 Tax=Agromyces aurantiacus TaxID=165814 RepID=A0ABV9R6E0_9MICO|nr:TadE family type IV pilus minor pilin [Agromyces aurantiacus]MBM7504015.1 Flp pilus assembly protein TadG [Agromyces aurantiacus]